MKTSKEVKSARMELKGYNVVFFFGVLLVISVVTFFIFQPFLIAIIIAAILATLFQGLFGFFLSHLGGRKGLSSFMTSLIILLIIVIPVSFMVVLVVNEISSFYGALSQSGDFYQTHLAPLADRLQAGTSTRSYIFKQFLSQETFTQYSSQIGRTLLSIAQTTYQSIIHIIFLALIMFFSLYYFLIDGKDIVKKIMYISPLRDEHEKLLISKFVSISRSTIKGTFIIALMQGITGTIMFSIVGIPSVATWAVLMGILSIIPLFGSGIIWIPAAIVLLLGGHLWQGIFILAVGFLVVSSIDNFIRPWIVGKDTQMHPLITLFATLGGLWLFGVIGFIIGPVIVALFLSLWDIYGVEFKTQLDKYNA
jgi:predicted PurR-regulated permease PerM